ncbi:hypothetical protein MNBD_GAMMA07-2744 [hydrothermal vent metagenome]|uniref:2Fe-2S ferredoxin-type domain-containing protein n=1 Tax=hydrothermal vent metagenome TaxID=652676 RepID=A0A3B0WV89_9ZZZZ
MTLFIISYDQQEYECRDNESIIDAALRQGIKIKFSCGKGSCHTCIMQCLKGELPPQSQKGLNDYEIYHQYFLPCCCYPVGHMKIITIPSKITHSSSGNTSLLTDLSSTKNQQFALDAEMWDALNKGKKLKIILDDFYQQVYQDEKLLPFFKNTTKKHSSEKQYSFLRQKFSGEKCYFGDRPKNAHHWMVINNELFDYREDLLIKCLRKHKLPEYLVQRWVKLDETFRTDIVKSTPQPKIINGVVYPLDGLETIKIDEGTLCDSCDRPIEKNEMVRYHLRLGLTYCSNCMTSEKLKQII